MCRFPLSPHLQMILMRSQRCCYRCSSKWKLSNITTSSPRNHRNEKNKKGRRLLHSAPSLWISRTQQQTERMEIGCWLLVMIHTWDCIIRKGDSSKRNIRVMRILRTFPTSPLSILGARELMEWRHESVGVKFELVLAMMGNMWFQVLKIDMFTVSAPRSFFDHSHNLTGRVQVNLVWDSGIARNSYGEFDVIKKRSEGTGFESFSSTSLAPSSLLLRHVTHTYLVVFSASSYSNSSTLRTCKHSIPSRFSRRSDLFQRRTLPSPLSIPVY